MNMVKSWPWFKIEMKTMVIEPHIKIFLLNKDSSTGYSERNKTEEKIDRRRDGMPILKGGHAMTLPAQLDIRTRA